MLGPTQFEVLNQKVELSLPEDWNNPQLDKLLLYHLHYLDDLNGDRAHKRLDWHQALVDRWVSENPPASGNGWEPYPLSLRIVNWIKWQFRESALSESATKSLYLQARVLDQTIEYHLLANHILANAKAMYFAGYFFDGSEANKWLRKGKKILHSQLDEQVLNDGGHFELSPMYHAIILEDMLDLINLFRMYGDETGKELEQIASGMLYWLRVMTHTDGQLSYFNDSTFDVAPSLTSLEEYAIRLGIVVPEESMEGVTVLAESGYARYDNDDLSMLIDIGEIGASYQPGHGHCDCLSFELSCKGRRKIVNTGVSTYNVCERRHLERSTSSHNTVSIAGVEQSEIWHAFRVGRRAFPVGVEVSDGRVRAGHDGFFKQRVLHHREFLFAGNQVEIIDELSGRHAVSTPGTAHFHFHPDVVVVVGDDHVKFDDMQIKFSNHRHMTVSDYEYCLGFNKRARAKVVSVEFVGRLNSEIRDANSLPL